MAILSAEAKSMISAIHPAMVATSDKSGRPNVSPKGSFQVLDDEHVLFADVHSPRTMANLAENAQVSAIVFDPGTRHGVRIWGTAEVQGAGDLLERVNSALAAMKVQAGQVVVVAVDDFATF